MATWRLATNKIALRLFLGFETDEWVKLRWGCCNRSTFDSIDNEVVTIYRWNSLKWSFNVIISEVLIFLCRQAEEVHRS